MKKYKPFIIASLIVLILWGINWFLVKNENRGTLGDMFGVVNSLFTGLSFAGIIYAMYLQNQELSLQRKELRDTRNVMKEQSDTLKLQTSETTFFRLLENHRSLVSSLSYGGGYGYVGLNSYYMLLKSNTEEYYRAALTGNIYAKQIAENYPLKVFSYQRENIEQFVENITHLIKLIGHKLNDDTFYHETFFNTLSKAEKYIFGFYIYNFKSDQISMFSEGHFNYLQFFEGSGNAFFVDRKVNYFPNLRFKFNRTFSPYTNFDLMKGKLPKEIGNIMISTLENIKGKSIILKSITIHDSNDDSQISDLKNFDLEIKHGKEINLTSEICENVFSRFVDFKKGIVLEQTYYSFSLYFKINCDEKNFIYKVGFHGQHIRQGNDNSGFQILDA